MSYGEPSKGLMQTITPAFSDPMENLKASVAYAMDRYGMVPGRLRAGEYVLTPEMAREIAMRKLDGEPTFEHLMRKGMLGDWQDVEPFDEYPEPPAPPVF